MTSDKEEIIKKALDYIANTDITPYKIAKETMLSEKTVGNYKNGLTKPTLANAETIIRYFEEIEHGSNSIANEVNSRIQKIIDDNFNGSIVEFCSKLNLSQAVVMTLVEKSKPSYDMLMSIIEDKDLGINMRWLLTGKGEPYNRDEEDRIIEERKQNFTTYLLPMSAMGGPLTGFAAPGVILENCEAIVSPIENVDFAITVYGESMAPEYPSGSRILIKKINPDIFIDWGKVYVLDTPNGVVVKEVHQSSKEGFISCHSINPDPKFKPFDVPVNEIFGMYRVLMCLSAK